MVEFFDLNVISESSNTHQEVIPNTSSMHQEVMRITFPNTPPHQEVKVMGMSFLNTPICIKRSMRVISEHSNMHQEVMRMSFLNTSPTSRGQ
jgi:hypothetical protein